MSTTTTNTKERIIAHARHHYAMFGYEGVSMRTLAEQVNIACSVFYHYFPTKDELLLEMYRRTNTALGEARKQNDLTGTFAQRLQRRILFQFDHMEEISAVLKYYLHFCNTFPHNHRGHLPPQSYKHIEEVLLSAEADGLFAKPVDIEGDAKVITHAINGYILEYYPSPLTAAEKKKLATQLTTFIVRAYSTQHTDGPTISSFLF